MVFCFIFNLENMRGDLSVRGLQYSHPVRIAAAATRYEAGEPLHNLGSLTNGVNSVNTYVLAAADTPVIGTHVLGGIAMDGATPFSTGTLVAHSVNVSRPLAWIGQLWGKGEVTTTFDTLSELTGLLLDTTLIDFNSTGAADGGELYTIKDAVSADTSGLQIVDGDFGKGLLAVVVDGRAYRHDVT
jgi:hypothetical protein